MKPIAFGLVRPGREPTYSRCDLVRHTAVSQLESSGQAAPGSIWVQSVRGSECRSTATPCGWILPRPQLPQHEHFPLERQTFTILVHTQNCTSVVQASNLSAARPSFQLCSTCRLQMLVPRYASPKKSMHQLNLLIFKPCN